MHALRTFLGTAFLTVVACSLMACDGGGGGSSAPPVGPSIKGKWTGVYYINPVSGSEREVKATIKQDGDAIIIKTDLEGIGEKFTGTIDEGGDMFLTDNFDGEIWTTHFMPVTESRVQIADYRFDISDDAIAIIDLTR